MNVICVIGDLIDSRKSKDRAALQARFDTALREINRVHARHLASPSTITLGDEYQAVYGSAGTLFMDFCDILARVHPARMRFSVGVGTLDTPVNRKQAIGMDGPAFHVAREAMNHAFKHSGRLFHIGHAGKPVPGWIQPALGLVSHELLSWHPNRLRILRQRLDGEPVGTIADGLGISQAAVYKNIQAGALDAVIPLVREIEAWLDGEVGA